MSIERVNPKNFIDIDLDPYKVALITFTDGNMIMIDETAQVKPNKKKIISKEEKNNFNESLIKEKSQELSLSEQINFFFIGNHKNEGKPVTINIKSDFNLISTISKNINFSFLKNNNIIEEKNKMNENIVNNNIPSPNSSIDIKSSMFQSSKNNNKNIIKINNTNNNILSEDNVNLKLTDTIFPNQINNYNEKINEEINSSNLLTDHFNDNNKNDKNNKIRIIKDTQKYTFDENSNNDNGNIDKNQNDNIVANNNEEIKNYQNELINKNNISNKRNGNLYNSNNQNEKNENNSYINNPSIIIQNNNFYSQNDFPKNNLTINEQNRNKDEIIEKNMTIEKRSRSIKYNRINKIRQKRKDNNYVKAVVSINIPAEEEENINLVKQFNSLVDRLNGQKSKNQAKEIIKKSDRYYELYKNQNEIFLNSFFNPEKNKKKIKHNYFDDIYNNINNFRNKSKYTDIN